MFARNQDDVAAAASIAAARSTARYIFFAAEGQAAIAAVAGLYFDFDLVDEHGGGSRL